jgi:hypothetical protein
MISHQITSHFSLPTSYLLLPTSYFLLQTFRLLASDFTLSSYGSTRTYHSRTPMRSAGLSHANLGPAELAGMTDDGIRMSSLLPADTILAHAQPVGTDALGIPREPQASDEMPVEEHVHVFG